MIFAPASAARCNISSLSPTRHSGLPGEAISRAENCSALPSPRIISPIGTFAYLAPQRTVSPRRSMTFESSSPSGPVSRHASSERKVPERGTTCTSPSSSARRTALCAVPTLTPSSSAKPRTETLLPGGSLLKLSTIESRLTVIFSTPPTSLHDTFLHPSYDSPAPFATANCNSLRCYSAGVIQRMGK